MTHWREMPGLRSGDGLTCGSTKSEQWLLKAKEATQIHFQLCKNLNKDNLKNISGNGPCIYSNRLLFTYLSYYVKWVEFFVSFQ